MILYQQILDTPLGNMIAITSNEAVYSLRFEDGKAYQWRENMTIIVGESEIYQELTKQVSQYFFGQRHTFTLPIKLTGTPFQNEVWQILSEIKYGQVMTYQDVAKRVAGQSCVRAVGTAIAKNPLYLLLPCHRVVRKDGHIGQYGGGINRKIALHQLESLEGTNL